MFVLVQTLLIKVPPTISGVRGFIPAISAVCTEFGGVECGYNCGFQSCACVCFKKGEDADLGAPDIAGLGWKLGPRPVRNAGPSICSWPLSPSFQLSSAIYPTRWQDKNVDSILNPYVPSCNSLSNWFQPLPTILSGGLDAVFGARGM